GAVHHAPEVDIHEPFKIVVTHVFDSFAETDTGIVHDDIDLAMLGHRVVRIAIDSITITHVDQMGADSDRIAGQSLDGPFQTVLTDVGKGQMTAFPCQSNSSGLTDSRTGASDGGDFAGESFHSAVPLRVFSAQLSCQEVAAPARVWMHAGCPLQNAACHRQGCGSAVRAGREVSRSGSAMAASLPGVAGCLCRAECNPKLGSGSSCRTRSAHRP